MEMERIRKFLFSRELRPYVTISYSRRDAKYKLRYEFRLDGRLKDLEWSFNSYFDAIFCKIALQLVIILLHFSHFTLLKSVNCCSLTGSNTYRTGHYANVSVCATTFPMAILPLKRWIALSIIAMGFLSRRFQQRTLKSRNFSAQWNHSRKATWIAQLLHHCLVIGAFQNVKGIRLYQRKGIRRWNFSRTLKRTTKIDVCLELFIL